MRTKVTLCSKVLSEKMINDAQVQSPPKLDVQNEKSTNVACDVNNRNIEVLEHKV